MGQHLVTAVFFRVEPTRLQAWPPSGAALLSLLSLSQPCWLLAALPGCLLRSSAFAGSSLEMISSHRASEPTSCLPSNATVTVASAHLTPTRVLFTKILDINLHGAHLSCLRAMVSFVTAFPAPRRKLGPRTHSINICGMSKSVTACDEN